MLPANKLFLLLITCALLAFACTSSKRKSPTAPPIGGGDQSGDSSKELKELRDKLGTALSKISELQEQVGKGAVSQSDLDDLEKALIAAQEEGKGELSSEVMAKITEAVNEVKIIKEEMAHSQGKPDPETLKRLEELEELLKEQLASSSGGNTPPTEEESDTTDQTEGIEKLGQQTTTTPSTPDNTTPTETEPAAAASDSYESLSIRVFMVEKKILPTDMAEARNNFQLERGTLLSIVSNKDITITAGEIKPYSLSEKEKQSIQNRAEGQKISLFMLYLPLALQLTYADNIYCAEATVTDQHMPPDNGEIRMGGSARGKEETMSVTRGECQ